MDMFIKYEAVFGCFVDIWIVSYILIIYFLIIYNFQNGNKLCTNHK